MVTNNDRGCYLDEAFELVVLCQELCLFLLQGEDVVCCLLQDGRLAGVTSKGEYKMRHVEKTQDHCDKTQHFYVMT